MQGYTYWSKSPSILSKLETPKSVFSSGKLKVKQYDHTESEKMGPNKAVFLTHRNQAEQRPCHCTDCGILVSAH